MKTPVNYLAAAIILFASLLIAGSSNHAAAIGFWQVLHAKANVISSYWLFPNYFSQQLTQLPDSALAILARNDIPHAQHSYSVKLLKNNRTDAAKWYWRSSVDQVDEAKRQQLAAQLLAQSQWQELQLLAKQGLLPPGAVDNHLKLHTSEPYQRVPTAFLQQHGFLSLTSPITAEPQCMFNVLMMSDHRNGLYKLAQFIHNYQRQPEPSDAVFCFSRPIYVAGAIDCQNSATSMARCDWHNAALVQQLPRGFDFMVMMTKQGSANVQSGVMQLNSTAHYQLFLHELMHFNGFEDEYELPPAKQAWLCQQRGFVAPNLFIAKDQPAPQGWYRSRSCQQGAVAYKPSEQWSIMQYQQLALSAQYRALWQAHIATHFALFPRYSAFIEGAKAAR